MGFGSALLGGFIGGMIFGPLGAVVGGVVGAAVGGKTEAKDSGRSASASGNTSSGDSAFELLLRSFGKLAKADGLVCQAEADLVTAFMRQMEFDSADKKRLIAAFNRGKSSAIPFAAMVEEIKNAFPSESHRTLMQIYCDLVLADGAVSEVELNFLRAAERAFGFTGFVDRWYDSLRDSSREDVPPADDLGDAYRILGVTPQNTPDEIKKAWREKAKEYHPDKLRGKNMPENIVKLAESKFRQAQSAYERIKRERNF